MFTMYLYKKLRGSYPSRFQWFNQVELKTWVTQFKIQISSKKFFACAIENAKSYLLQEWRSDVAFS